MTTHDKKMTQFMKKALGIVLAAAAAFLCGLIDEFLKEGDSDVRK